MSELEDKWNEVIRRAETTDALFCIFKTRGGKTQFFASNESQLSNYTPNTDGFILSSFEENELKMMPMGAKVMTYECGMRFLTDYLEGDVYFRTTRPEHNIERARNQFKLVADMEAHMDEMNAIVAKYKEKYKK